MQIGQPISIILTDAAGVVLTRLTADHDLERHLDGVKLAPGFSYAEERGSGKIRSLFFAKYVRFYGYPSRQPTFRTPTSVSLWAWSENLQRNLRTKCEGISNP